MANAYYWHRFYSHQPDLNFDNPAVLEHVIRAMKFWLDMGVDGLRLDAIPYLVERDGTNCENLPETHVLIKAIRRELDRYENRMMLAEANQWPTDVRPYFGDGTNVTWHSIFQSCREFSWRCAWKTGIHHRYHEANAGNPTELSVGIVSAQS